MEKMSHKIKKGKKKESPTQSAIDAEYGRNDQMKELDHNFCVSVVNMNWGNMECDNQIILNW